MSIHARRFAVMSASSIRMALAGALVGAAVGCASAQTTRAATTQGDAAPQEAPHARGGGAGHAMSSAFDAPCPDAEGKFAGPDDRHAALSAVATFHGGAGPWAVVGFRMGCAAIRTLGVARGSFDLEVAHHSPHEVQFTCIADGTSASTGASVGRMTLSMETTDVSALRTTYRRKSTGTSVTLRPTAAFAARFKDRPREELGAAGYEAMGMADAELFEVLPGG